jgi:hypothetical protein
MHLVVDQSAAFKREGEFFLGGERFSGHHHTPTREELPFKVRFHPHEKLIRGLMLPP